MGTVCHGGDLEVAAPEAVVTASIVGKQRGER